MWHLLHTRIYAECFIGICFYNSLVSSTRNILCPVYRQSNYYLQGLKTCPKLQSWQSRDSNLCLPVSQVLGSYRTAIKKMSRDFPGGTVDRNPPASVGDTGSIPDPAGSNMPWSNGARVPQLLRLCPRA